MDCSSGVQQGDPVGPALFCMPLLPVLERVREEFEPRGVEGCAYCDGISIGHHTRYVTPNTQEVEPLFQHELCEIGIAINPSKPVTLPPEGHVLTPEELPLLEGITDRVKALGVPIYHDAHAVGSATVLR